MQDTLMITSVLCCFMCRYWMNVFPPISGKFELIHESLGEFTLPQYFFFLLVSSSPCMFIHVKLYQRPTYTSLSNKYQARSRYNWLAQMLPAPRGQLYNRERPCQLNHDEVTSGAGMGSTFQVLQSVFSVYCETCEQLCYQGLNGEARSSHCVQLQDQLNSKVY